MKKIAKIKKDINLRKQATHSQRMKRIGPQLKNLSRPHKRGAPVSKAEKEMVLYMYDKQLGNVCSRSALCSRNFRNVKLRLDFVDFIILPPFRFYMKSNFGEFKRSKNVDFNNFRGSEFRF